MKDRYMKYEYGILMFITANSFETLTNAFTTQKNLIT